MLSAALIATVLTLFYMLVTRAAYTAGYGDGHQDGGDDLANEWLAASCDAPDLIERTWPANDNSERRPQ